MKRDEAINVLKEISEACTNLETYQVMIMPPNANGVLSTGNQIHVKVNLDQESMMCIKPFLAKRGLAVKQEKNLLIIYKPMQA